MSASRCIVKMIHFHTPNIHCTQLSNNQQLPMCIEDHPPLCAVLSSILLLLLLCTVSSSILSNLPSSSSRHYVSTRITFSLSPLTFSITLSFCACPSFFISVTHFLSVSFSSSFLPALWLTVLISWKQSRHCSVPVGPRLSHIVWHPDGA